MKFPAFLAAGLPFVMSAPAMAAEKSGHAEASLMCNVISYQPGKPVLVGIKLKIDPEWHSYWVNPGEGGMPISAKWTLPDGWKAGELKAPVPKRFMTGELPGFGYEGTAVYFVDITPPAAAAGEAKLKVKLSWLTCNDSACIPGDAELTLDLPEGQGAPAEIAEEMEAAMAKIPKTVPETTSSVAEKDGRVVMTFSVPGDYDFEGSEAFPATPEVVDAGATIELKKTEEGWTASAPKNEYAEGSPAAYDLVLTGGKLSHSVLITWRGK